MAIEDEDRAYGFKIMRPLQQRVTERAIEQGWRCISLSCPLVYQSTVLEICENCGEVNEREEPMKGNVV